MMMEAMESCNIPPGFRFHPTDEELVGYYLRKKVASQKVDLDVIRDIDLYKIEPWDLQERCRIGYEEQNEWYFFSHKDKKYPTGTRTNRATTAGFWKATGRDKAVYDKNKLIGMRKTLVFYKGRAPNGQKTDWIMHEYRLESDENAPPQEEGWVVCRAFRKRSNIQAKSIEAWESTYFYDESCVIGTGMEPLEYLSRQSPEFMSTDYTCKQEISEAYNMSYTRSGYFTRLPPMENGPIPSMKMATSSSPMASGHRGGEEDGSHWCNNENARVTDWRAFDKLVAYHLCNEDGRDSHGVSGTGMNSDVEMPMCPHGNTGEDEGQSFGGFIGT